MNKYRLKRRTLLVAGFCIAVLSACQTASAPEYKYYRLLPATSAAAQAFKLPGEFGIRPLRADGLYMERAIIFTDEQQRRLQQYHYHYWMYPPGQLVQEHLAALLSHGKARPVVKLPGYGGETPYAISGRIVRFEKITVAGKAKAAVSLELNIEKKGHVSWQQTYAVDEAIAGTTMMDFSTAVESALGRIYEQFLGDVARATLE